MKRTRLTYDRWTCMLQKEHHYQLFNHKIIDGYISLLDIKEITGPQYWTVNGERIVVCNTDYKWLCILPRNEHYCITAMINDLGEIILWYIDMIDTQGIDSDQVPYFDDLYLDLVVSPNGVIFEDDRDELEEALAMGDISPQQFHLANATCDKLRNGLLHDIEALKQYTYQCMKLLMNEK